MSPPGEICLSSFFRRDSLTRNQRIYEEFLRRNDALTKIKNRTWRAPKSPYNLLEEDLWENPWWILVAAIFLNKTSCKAARRYVFDFLRTFPCPLAVLGASSEELREFFKGLGLQDRRALQVRRMSEDFLLTKWACPSQLYGIGRYGRDAYEMFCNGDFRRIPTDRWLRLYRAWYLNVYNK